MCTLSVAGEFLKYLRTVLSINPGKVTNWLLRMACKSVLGVELYIAWCRNLMASSFDIIWYTFAAKGVI